jgi:hypothetical protein
VKKTVSILIVLVVAVFAVELLSSYFLYRYYANSDKSFVPMGSAALVLAARAADWVRGVHRETNVSVDDGTVFKVSDVLGFTISPGRHQVTELFDGKKHVFDLNVTDAGRRASSYLPVRAPKRLFVTGDSSFFGWGVDNEETIPWLLQSRLPDFEVVNLSLNSYSTVHALLQLQQVSPKIAPDDVVVLVYHPVTNDFNVAAPATLRQFLVGYELQLADRAKLSSMMVPYGAIGADGNFSIHRVSLSCFSNAPGPDCAHPEVTPATAEAVTKRAFDEIIALHMGRTIVAVCSGPDDDPVIAHLRARGVPIADVRTVNGYPEKTDIIPTDLHAGPFWHHQVYVLLLQALQREHFVE